MPAKNRTKEYVADTYYHLYNRGVEKRIIFADTQDYNVFLSYLATYLLPKDELGLMSIIGSESATQQEKDTARKLLRMNNFYGKLTLHAYCLMPNHFHLLVHQTEEMIIDQFMNSLFTRYSMYFNRKYKRVGPLFQSLYKAVRVVSDEQLQHLSRYIHRNPMDLAVQGPALQSYPHSSYGEYLGLRNSEWVNVEKILALFLGSEKKYEQFVEQRDDEATIQQVGALLFDESSEFSRARPGLANFNLRTLPIDTV